MSAFCECRAGAAQTMSRTTGPREALGVTVLDGLGAATVRHPPDPDRHFLVAAAALAAGSARVALTLRRTVRRHRQSIPQRP